jgi:predicted RNase H-like HicB family nuclease
MKSKPYTFNVLIERDADGFLVGTVPELRGCHSQAKSMDVLLRRMREAVELCLEVEDEVRESPEFVGVQRITI